MHREQAVENFEAEQVGDQERRKAEQRVADDEKGDEQPVIPPHSRSAGLPACDCGIDVVGQRRAPTSRRTSDDRSAETLGVAADGDRIEGACATPRAGRRRTPRPAVRTSTPVTPSTTLSTAPPSRQRHDRPAARLRLHRDHPEVLDAGHQDRAAALIQVPNLVIGQPAGELHVGASVRIDAAAGLFGPLPDDFQR